MLKIFLWVASEYTTYLEDALKILERQHNGIEIVGVTSAVEVTLDINGKNIPFVPFKDAVEEVYDVLLVVSAKPIGMSDITKVARQLNLPEEKLLGDWIVCIPGFTLDKYRRLQRLQLSIFAQNCFGGMISNMLGLPFRSPFVNLLLIDEDFIKFLREPHSYLNEKLIFKDTAFNNFDKFYFPVVKLSNIDLYMTHYRDFDTAVAKWNERKQRINWFNLFVTAYTEDEKILQEFDALPYGKKVCFVPFKSELDSAWYINPEIDRDTFNEIIIHFSQGKIFYYDVFDMLLYGKKTQLIDM